MQSGRTPMLLASLASAPQTPWEWILAVINIIWIDMVLAGDNAVVIALAVRNLPARERLMGIILGSGAAVALRGVLTFFATKLLLVPYVQLIGALLILWIAFKLLKQGEGDGEDGKEGARGLWQAVWMILVADITMSLDNVLAVGGAARGSEVLIWFGLALSIPLVVFASNLISRLMARYPILVLLGAAILGKVAGEMMLTDPVVASRLAGWWASVVQAADPASSYRWLRLGWETVLVVTIFAFGWSRRRREVEEGAAA